LKRFKNLFFFFIFCSFIFFITCSQANAAYRWDKIGIDMNMTLYLSPNYEEDKTIYSLAGTDVYQSTDECKTWTKINTMPVWHMQISNDKSIYTLQSSSDQALAIYKFQTSEKRWEKVCDVPSNTKSFSLLSNGNIIVGKPYKTSSLWQLLLSDNHGLSWSDTGYNYGSTVLVDTPDGLVFTREDKTGFGGRGKDFGSKWERLNKTYEFDNFYISPNYTRDQTVFSIMNRSGIYQSTDEGEYWNRCMSGIEGNNELVSIAFSPNYVSDKTVYAADRKGHIFKSINRGLEWGSIDIELDESKLNNIIILPNNKIFAGTESGVYKVTYKEPPVNFRTVTAKFKIGQPKYTIGSSTWLMDAVPYVLNERTYVPVRYLAYALGINDSGIHWDSITNEVTITKNGTVMKLTPSKAVLMINDKPVLMDVLPQVNNGRLMLPARWVAEAFGAIVTWDEPTQTVVIEYQVKEN